MMLLGMVQEELSAFGINITERTLKNYVAWGLIPQPIKEGGGAGKQSEYPGHTLPEAYAAWKLLHHEALKTSPQKVKECRENALYIVESEILDSKTLVSNKTLKEKLSERIIEIVLVHDWLKFWSEIIFKGLDELYNKVYSDYEQALKINADYSEELKQDLKDICEEIAARDFYKNCSALYSFAYIAD
ncbi:hypothetical protein ACOBQJ_00695 [Pelotomaculum propionicicum]|uniref:hypothetical protein n=1 Tax=Pelotomaculum propionicicum TaxID=258475 RepID=UPI003B81DCC4